MSMESCGLAGAGVLGRVSRKRRLLVVALRAALVLVVAVVMGHSADACNTPVYRYAMYNWQTAPYFVFHFHDGEVTEEDQAINDAIAKLTEDYPPQANVRVEAIDVSDEKQMERLPDFVIEAWKEYEEGKTPAHVIFAPWRAHVYSGKLDAESMKNLLDSPARQQLGQLLGEGNAAVMILLTCPDKERNKKAEEAIAGLKKLADKGDILVELELPVMGLPGEGEEGEGEGEGEDGGEVVDLNKLGIGMLTVDRDDPAEEFFVRMLMSIEDDLDEYADQPMIFAGYGRGRAMEPYIGKGISVENLADVVTFLAGACSCMVKEQNPGADLLIQWDWEATADKMAENDPSLDYGPYGYGEYPADPGEAEAAESEQEAGDDELAAADPAEEPTEEATVAVEENPAGTESAPVEASLPEPAPVDPSEMAVSPGHTASPGVVIHGQTAKASFANQRMFTYAISFGAIALGILLAGLALLIRRS